MSKPPSWIIIAVVSICLLTLFYETIPDFTMQEQVILETDSDSDAVTSLEKQLRFAEMKAARDALAGHSLKNSSQFTTHPVAAAPEGGQILNALGDALEKKYLHQTNRNELETELEESELKSDANAELNGASTSELERQLKEAELKSARDDALGANLGEGQTRSGKAMDQPMLKRHTSIKEMPAVEAADTSDDKQDVESEHSTTTLKKRIQQAERRSAKDNYRGVAIAKSQIEAVGSSQQGPVVAKRPQKASSMLEAKAKVEKKSQQLLKAMHAASQSSTLPTLQEVPAVTPLSSHLPKASAAKDERLKAAKQTAKRKAFEKSNKQLKKKIKEADKRHLKASLRMQSLLHTTKAIAINLKKNTAAQLDRDKKELQGKNAAVRQEKAAHLKAVAQAQHRLQNEQSGKAKAFRLKIARDKARMAKAEKARLQAMESQLTAKLRKAAHNSSVPLSLGETPQNPPTVDQHKLDAQIHATEAKTAAAAAQQKVSLAKQTKQAAQAAQETAKHEPNKQAQKQAKVQAKQAAKRTKKEEKQKMKQAKKATKAAAKAAKKAAKKAVKTQKKAPKTAHAKEKSKASKMSQQQTLMHKKTEEEHAAKKSIQSELKTKAKLIKETQHQQAQIKVEQQQSVKDIQKEHTEKHALAVQEKQSKAKMVSKEEATKSKIKRKEIHGKNHYIGLDFKPFIVSVGTCALKQGCTGITDTSQCQTAVQYLGIKIDEREMVEDDSLPSGCLYYADYNKLQLNEAGKSSTPAKGHDIEVQIVCHCSE